MDMARLERIREIMQFHFDLEIIHKQYEERFLNSEIERRRELMAELKQLVYYEYLLQARLKDASAAEDGGPKNQETVGDGEVMNANSTSTSLEAQQRTARKATRGASLNEQAYQFERRADGVIVK